MARPSGFSPVLLALLAIGIAAGAAASFVVSASRPFATTGSFSNTLVSPTVLGAILLFPLVAGFGSILYQRGRGGKMPVPPVLMALALILIAFLAVFALLSYAPHSSGSPFGGSPGGGSSPTTPTNNSTSTNKSGSGGGTPILPAISSLPIPSWLILVIGVVIALAAIGLGVPAARAMAARRSDRAALRTSDRDRSAATAAFGQALDELGSGADPRQVVERLYVQLISQIPRVAGDVSPLSPEEIRVASLLPLGIRPTAANEITRIFEEARYSSHPIDAGQAARVRAAFSIAWADLSGRAAAQ